jgi:hypothetical protein
MSRKAIRLIAHDGRSWAKLSPAELDKIVEDGELVRAYCDEKLRPYMLAALEAEQKQRDR